MACKRHERQVVNQLLHDGRTRLKMSTSATSNDSKGSKHPEDSKHSDSTCYIPRSLLASVSPKLVDTCSRGLRLTHVNEKVVRIFVTWLLYQKLDVEEDDECIMQIQLAQAWNSGAEYEMSAFQDNVMRKLFKILDTERIHPDAVVEAYRPHERGSLLQRAFVQQLASNMEEDVEGIVWNREDFTGYALGADSQFLLDLQFAGAMGDVEDYLSSTAQDDA